MGNSKKSSGQRKRLDGQQKAEEAAAEPVTTDTEPEAGSEANESSRPAPDAEESEDTADLGKARANQGASDERPPRPTPVRPEDQGQEGRAKAKGQRREGTPEEWLQQATRVLGVKTWIVRAALSDTDPEKKYTEDEIRDLIQRKLSEPA